MLLAVKPDVAEAVLLHPGRQRGPPGAVDRGRHLDRPARGGRCPPVRWWCGPCPTPPPWSAPAWPACRAGSAATAADLDWAEGILAAVGTVVRLPERQLDAVTGVSGSGPAYVFLVAEAMIEAGVTAGLPRDVSRQLVVGTLLGSARMLDETGEDPAELRAAVTSPGGTTAAAVRTLEFKAVRSAFIEAVAAAVERSRQLGR